MTDSTRPEGSARTPDESPGELGNTIDGSGAGDGSTTRGGDEKDFAARPDRAAGGASQQQDAGAAAGTGATPGAGGDRAAIRDEQKKLYQTPEQPDRAVGGSDGTADGQ